MLDPTSTENPVFATVETIPINDFLLMPPAPGHRDSAGRAPKASHLFVLIPEHLGVDVAEWSHNGVTKRALLTGNTRKYVWKAGLSDRVPNAVHAHIWVCKDEDEVRERMLRHDSQEAAWKTSDYTARALDMAFNEDYRPRSKPLQGSRFVSALRRTDALVNRNRWTPDSSVRVEMVLRDWQREFRLLDDILDHPVAQTLSPKNIFTYGFMAALLILIHFKGEEATTNFTWGILNDRGEKTDEGYDGIQALIQLLADPAKSFGTGATGQCSLINATLGAFDLWETKEHTPQVAKIKKTDALEWIHNERVRKHEETKKNQAA